jgi:hypothetical protein
MGDGDEFEFSSTRPAEDLFVCSCCIDDADIKNFIESEVCVLSCDFCGKVSQAGPIAAPLEDVVRFMLEAVEREYDKAVNALGWESAEGGYQGSHWDSHELLTDQLDLSLPNDDGRLLEILVECFGDNDWCERNPYSLREDELYISSWEQFCEYIKHERRYFFLQRKAGQTESDNDELLSPAKLLQFIGETVAEYGLIRTMPIESVIYRARQQKAGQQLKSSLDFGPPPTEYAIRSNRMSPAGIVMFYGSSEEATAIAEIDDDPALGISVGKFNTLRELRILDLTRLPRPLGFFEPQPDSSTENRYVVSFLTSFGESLAARVEPGDREHIDYVPTQVVTEWFRTVPPPDEQPIDGICYPSAPCEGGTSLVLFADQTKIALTTQEIDEFKQRPDKGLLDDLIISSRQKEAWLLLVGSRSIRAPKGP